MVAEYIALSASGHDAAADVAALAPTPLFRSYAVGPDELPSARARLLVLARPFGDLCASASAGGSGLVFIHAAHTPDLIALAVGCSILAVADLARQGGYRIGAAVNLAATLRSIARAVSVAAIVALALGLSVRPHVFLVAAATMATGLVLARVAGGAAARRRVSATRALRVAVIGETLAGKMVLQELATRSRAECVVLGYIAMSGEATQDLAAPARFGRFPRLGSMTHLARTLVLERVDEVVVALPSSAHGEMAHIMDICRSVGVAVRVAAHDGDGGFVRMHPEALGGIPVVRVGVGVGGGEAIPGWTKRALDLSIASIALLAALPLLALAAFAIRLESPGPILFRQERIGKDGRVFTIFKLRSMRADAEQQLALLAAENEACGPLFKMRTDPRVTQVGRILRKLSVDELPQLWNVLCGDMSLVGPRPPLAREVALYEDWHLERLHATPGITCLWGVRGRSALDFDEMAVMDIYYIHHYSMLMDITILWRTALSLVRPSGAY